MSISKSKILRLRCPRLHFGSAQCERSGTGVNGAGILCLIIRSEGSQTMQEDLYCAHVAIRKFFRCVRAFQSLRSLTAQSRCNGGDPSLRAGVSMFKIPHYARDDKGRITQPLGHHDLDWMKAIQAKHFIIHPPCHPERSEGSQTIFAARWVL